MNQSSFLSLCLGCLCLIVSATAQAEPVQVRNVLIADGTGSPLFAGAVSFAGGTIAAIDPANASIAGARVIDGGGRLILAPGFIDIHSHSERGLVEDPKAATQVSQGITTLIQGADGGAPFPPAAYLRKLREGGTAVNVGLMVGHGTIRSLVLGEDYRRPASADETQAMQALVRLAMRQGALGISSGLEYDPGFYSTTEELISLAREAGAHGGFYMTHMRDEEDGFMEALREAIRIGKEADLPVQISHIKLGNKRVWGQTAEVFRLLDQAESEGVDITADCYPYAAWASGLGVLVPSRRFDDRAEVAEAFDKIGGPHNVLITRYEPDSSYEFRDLAEIARSRGIDPVDLYIEMMKNGGAGIVGRSMNPDDVHALYRDSRVMVASDGGTDSRHPRMSGTFPRVLGHFVRDLDLFPVEEAIRKMTSLPARRLRLEDRGVLRVGARADLVLFDPSRIRDRSDFQNPHLLSEGVEQVFVNGIAVWAEGKPTGELPGQILLRQRD